MSILKINETPVRTSRNFNINNVKLEDIQIPENLKEFKGTTIVQNNSNIKLSSNIEKYDITYGLGDFFTNQVLEKANKNINIISGLAKGVDSYAHIGTLSTVGKTIAVVGNGLDSVYPVENKELLYRILKKGGAIISEYPLGTRPEKMNFPARNRIISGMSKGVIVIEAKKKSGTLITVDFALEQGRDVYVIPGNINSVNSAGTNELIKQGAKLVTTYDEIEI